jgi:hypothetical protein
MLTILIDNVLLVTRGSSALWVLSVAIDDGGSSPVQSLSSLLLLTVLEASPEGCS